MRRTTASIGSILCCVLVALSCAMPALAQDAVEGVKRTIPGNIQGTAEVGVVVRVKEVLVAEDATLVTISASYAGETSFLNLADTDSGTYLQDENGQKFPLRKPDENKWLRVVSGDTMHGRLVFLGVVAPESKKLKLVFNAGNTGDDTTGPGLTIDIPLS